jgi:hypothetical protein
VTVTPVFDQIQETIIQLHVGAKQQCAAQPASHPQSSGSGSVITIG